jgi:D-sedoheptulose 7-phosphate isomerase
VDGLDRSAAFGVVQGAFDRHAKMFAHVRELAEPIVDAADIAARSLAAGGTLLLCGNGGSAADAQHLAAEFVGRFARDREAWAAIALHTNTSALTAVGNDYGFDEVFARQVRAFGRPDGVLIAISTSGSSPNVLRAVDEAYDRGMRVIGLTGPGGGRIADKCDVLVPVAGDDTPSIQEGHILVGHIICALVENALAE